MLVVARRDVKTSGTEQLTAESTENAEKKKVEC